ncbi:MAG: hypothetical protein ACXIUB_03275 [Wenzhouxiangella sp.]
MKFSSVFLVLLGVGMAFLGAMLVMLIMPAREMVFIYSGVELPGITLLLLNSPWVTLLFPALTVVAALAARKNARYVGKTCALGFAFLALNISLIVLFGYWPFR